MIKNRCFPLASARERGECGSFSGFARKMNHLSSFCASEASAKVPFNAHFEFMYGFKTEIRQIRHL
ncbi:MAG: hypothetical protein U5L45_07635 [Saprospiraceae bacterium]|nr:hypothetical protein [Saprospiraceae bacterium]